MSLKSFLATTLAVSAGLVTTSASAFDVERIVNSGDPTNRINVVILGDGFRAQDQAELTAKANELVTEFQNLALFSSYKQYFNFTVVHTISNTNGAIDGDDNPNPDTIFGSYYNCAGIDRLICLGDEAAVFNVLATDVPEYQPALDIAIVVVNDSKYGGSGGTLSTYSVNEFASQIAVHEIGHSFGNLADEYSDPYPGYPDCQNECPEPNATTSAHLTLATLKWGHWVENGTNLPTTGNDPDLVGAYQGGRYQPSTVYRPVPNCIMRSLGQAYCPVCSEAMILRVYDKTRLVEMPSPSAGTVTVGTESIQAFSIIGPKPEPDSIKATWTVDGAEVFVGPTLNLDGKTLTEGAHTLKVDLIDESAIVREDPNSLLTDTHSWELDVIPVTSSTTGSGGSGGSGSGGTGSGGSPSDGDGDGDDESTSTVTCNCQVPGSISGNAYGALAIGALVFAFARRRRS